MHGREPNVCMEGNAMFVCGGLPRIYGRDSNACMKYQQNGADLKAKCRHAGLWVLCSCSVTRSRPSLMV